MARRPQPWFWKARDGWYVTIGGKRHPLGRHKDEAYERFYALMRQPQQRKVCPESLAAIIDAFLEWVERNRSPDTYEWYRYRLQRFIEIYPDLRASELRPHHVETWADGYDFSITSKRNYLRSVKRCMKWAKKQGYVDRNPIEDLEVPVAEHREIAISKSQFDIFMSSVRNESFSDLVTVTWESGCRPQESLRVETRHVDLANRRWVFPRAESKTKRIARVVYLTDIAFEITRRLMFAYPEGPLFRNVQGKPWTKDAVNCAFSAVQIRLGRNEMRKRGESVSNEAIAEFIPTLNVNRIQKGVTVPKTSAELQSEAKRKLTFKRATRLAPRYSLYALRHSWATNALKNGIDSLTVAILMGHEDPSTLARVYQHLSLNPEHLLEQARRAAS